MFQGKFKNINETLVNGVIKVSNQGVLDVNYGVNGLSVVPISFIYDNTTLSLIDDNENIILYYSYFNFNNNTLIRSIIKLDTNGNLDRANSYFFKLFLTIIN